MAQARIRGHMRTVVLSMGRGNRVPCDGSVFVLVD
jgi:hypothetical protein